MRIHLSIVLTEKKGLLFILGFLPTDVNIDLLDFEPENGEDIAVV